MSQDVISGRAAALPKSPSRIGEQALALLYAHWLPLVLTLVALALRTYRLQAIGWVPDNYEQLAATERLLHLDFPLSRLYSPGVALIMVPFVAVFPRDIATLQGVIVAAGVAMVPLGYVAARRLTSDILAATLFAAILALDPAFVYKSRDPHYDLLVAFLLGASLALLGPVRRSSIPACIAYGFLLSLLINIRPTNAALLPVLALYWAALEWRTGSWSAVLQACVSYRVVAVTATIVVAVVAGIVFGGWWGQATGAPLTFEHFGGNLRFYFETTFGDLPVLLWRLPLAVYGLITLRRRAPELALALLALLVIWPLAHAPFYWATGRYMLPAQLCVIFLMAFGAAQAWATTQNMSSRLRDVVRRAVAPAAVAVMSLFLVVPSGIILKDWPAIAARSDEGGLRQLRPIVARMDNGSLVVSADARGLRDGNAGVGFADLLEYHVRYGTGTEAQARLVAQVQQAIYEQRPVYYLYTRWEDGIDYEGNGRNGFVGFWRAVSASFTVTQVEHSPPTDDANVRPWTLYRITQLP